jgi:hypothetical protein
MFPIRFANAVIEKYTSRGDTVLDPFAGRGTAVFSAAALGRHGLGVEISPVGWVYARAKLGPAPVKKVEARLLEILASRGNYSDKAKALPKFFKKCFSLPVRRFLLAARDRLDWRRCAVDRTLMAILLVYLHGKNGQALSNRMRQTKAMSPQYAMDWWLRNNSKPPKINVGKFMRKRIAWRYAKGVLAAPKSRIFLGNSISRLPNLGRRLPGYDVPKAKLLLTSPPYFGVTNYHYDQWLRLWLLGFETDAYVARGPYQGRFTNPDQYKSLLRKVFCHAATVVAKESVIYVRTSKNPFTRKATLDAMLEAFPSRRLKEEGKPFQEPTQTHLFGDKSRKPGEVDLILLPGIAPRQKRREPATAAKKRPENRIAAKCC